MTDPHAHWDDLTEADYADAVEDEARFLAFNDDDRFDDSEAEDILASGVLPVGWRSDPKLNPDHHENNRDEAPVDPNIAARKRELRTVLDRVTPALPDLEAIDAQMIVALKGIMAAPAAKQEDARLEYRGLGLLLDSLVELRSQITHLHQLLGDD
jgi:hypothetical protein